MLRLLAGVAAANNALARDQGTTGDSWSRLLSPLLRLAHGNHRVVIVSDFLNAPDRDTADHAGLDALVGMARHNEVELLFVHDPLEGRLPPAQRYRVTDGVRHHTFHSRSAALRRAYAERFDTRRGARRLRGRHGIRRRGHQRSTMGTLTERTGQRAGTGHPRAMRGPGARIRGLSRERCRADRRS